MSTNKHLFLTMAMLLNIVNSMNQDCTLELVENEVLEKDIIYDQLRSLEFLHFRWKMIRAFQEKTLVQEFISAIPRDQDYFPNKGDGLCQSKHLDVYGFWQNDESKLCWVVQHDVQKVKVTQCSTHSGCHGNNTKCLESAHTRTSFLVYCDHLSLPTVGDGFDPSLEFQDPDLVSLEEIDASGDSSTGGAGNSEKGTGFYLAHLYLPQACTCRRCSCGSCEHANSKAYNSYDYSIGCN